MKKPILILGYERSGTTLLRRIVSMHPDLEYDIVHEQKEKLFKSKTKEDSIRRLTIKSKQNGVFTGAISSILSGQKIPYLDFKTVKKSVDKFSQLFEEYWIIHILRNKDDAIKSQIKTFKRDKNICIRNYKSVPLVMDFLKKQNNVLFFNFEDLLSDSFDNIKLIYEWMGDFNEDDLFLNKVISTKEQWNYKGRVMCGLRYFSDIKRRL
ncbi:MAG: sulfotransferase [Clostridiales bacterium]|nr:sulfotransferase [Clostridiales bacterium]